jgi:hypothetical protein
MSCHDYEADIVDLARGVETDGPRGAAARAHMESCPCCAARFEQERQLTAGLRALAERACDVEPDDEGERRVLEMFAARQETLPDAGRAGIGQGSFAWLAAAAALALTVGAAWGVVRWRSAGLQVPVATVAGGVAQPVVDSASRGDAPTGPRTPAARSATPPTTSAAASEASAVRATAASGSASPAAPRGAAPQREVTDSVDQFVALPATENLPGLESGLIVRVELPVSSLPAYGLPIVPDVRQAPVEADVLVGQDGQPRAIRLVSMQTVSRRRQ